MPGDIRTTNRVYDRHKYDGLTDNPENYLGTLDGAVISAEGSGYKNRIESAIQKMMDNDHTWKVGINPKDFPYIRQQAQDRSLRNFTQRVAARPDYEDLAKFELGIAAAPAVGALLTSGGVPVILNGAKQLAKSTVFNPTFWGRTAAGSAADIASNAALEATTGRSWGGNVAHAFGFDDAYKNNNLVKFVTEMTNPAGWIGAGKGYDAIKKAVSPRMVAVTPEGIPVDIPASKATMQMSATSNPTSKLSGLYEKYNITPETAKLAEELPERAAKKMIKRTARRNAGKLEVDAEFSGDARKLYDYYISKNYTPEKAAKNARNDIVPFVPRQIQNIYKQPGIIEVNGTKVPIMQKTRIGRHPWNAGIIAGLATGAAATPFASHLFADKPDTGSYEESYITDDVHIIPKIFLENPEPLTVTDYDY